MNPTEYTFETYVTIPSNRFARLAAETISKSPEINFNPLYIYGPPGVGKTHLLQAMAKEYESRGLTATYLPCNQFFEEMVQAIQNGTNAEFREKYYQVDVLILDRLEYVAGKEATQEELFNIMQRRYLNYKQTVLAGTTHPTQIPILDPRLSAHLTLGLSVEIPTPDFDGKVEIIAQKLRQNGLDWPIEACRYVAPNTSSGANQIEGQIKRIITCKELF